MKVGWIGTGVMGKSMAMHLINKGHSLVVFNRTASKADDLVKAGAVFAESPRSLAEQVDFLFLMLGYPKDVEDMVFCPQSGILNHIKKGACVIDHTTSSPALAERIAKELKERGIHSVDAPVSGGDIGARNGKLVTMIGGEQEAVDLCLPLLESYSAECKLMGGPGAG